MAFAARFLVGAGLLVALAGAAHAVPCHRFLVVLDASATMAEDAAGHLPGDPAFQGPSRWQSAVAWTTKLVEEFADQLPMGIVIAQAPIADPGAGPDARAAACAAAAFITVEPAHNQKAALLMALARAHPSGNANLGDVLQAAMADRALQSTENRPGYLVVITDGATACNPGDDPATRAFTKRAITLAHGAYLETMIVDVASAPDATLDGLALSGQLGPPGCGLGQLPPVPCYYALDQAASDKVYFLADSEGPFCDFCSLCDDSCYSLGCPAGQLCTTTEVNPEPHCAAPMCSPACAAGQFCRLTTCVPVCPACLAGQLCSDGKCVADRCAGVTCGTSQVCDPTSGKCVDFPCPSCRTGDFCDVPTGVCLSDGCATGATCPAGSHCVNHDNCEMDAPPTNALGCSCRMLQRSTRVSHALQLGVLLLALRLFRRQPRRGAKN